MVRKAPGFVDTLGQWLIAEGLVPEDEGAGSLADAARVRALLVAAARERRAVSYSELLAGLGHRFTRPKMRAVCKTLDAIDMTAAAAGEPELAVLVVRETDRLPGQGWWTGVREAHGYDGAWSGPDAVALVARLQARAFDYWGAEARRG
ncbi:ribose-phosphate pyrophosphokinase [Sphingomonas sp. MS122]|uniref:ribose-phosphate pyrophosphokinase n=1 Tax=Sphingomonas sp. MS122 TaxID=3412683 RepID=UPI003C2C7D8B